MANPRITGAKATFSIFAKDGSKLGVASFDPKALFHDYRTCGKKGCTACVITIEPVPPVELKAEGTLNIERWYTGEEWDRLMNPPKMLTRDDAEWDF